MSVKHPPAFLLLPAILCLTFTAFYSEAQSASDTVSRFEEKRALLAGALSESGRGINSSFISAVRRIPRELFLGESYTELAYEDISLPGLSGGMLPSPSDVAAAVNQLSPGASDTVLVAGNNAGYAAAVLALVSSEVYLIEETDAAGQYMETFNLLGIDNIVIAENPDIATFDEVIAFDRILIHGTVPEVSERITERLSIQGNITFAMSLEGGFQQLITLQRSILGDSIRCGGSCFFPEIERLKVGN